jgi:hypothetical protein
VESLLSWKKLDSLILPTSLQADDGVRLRSQAILFDLTQHWNGRTKFLLLRITCGFIAES